MGVPYIFADASQSIPLAELDANFAAVGSADNIEYNPPFANSTVETVTTKLSQIISVKDFGAIGNGIANDSEAVQYAYNAVKSAGGGVLFFPPGTYLCNIVGGGSDNVSMQGSGTNSILKSWTANEFAVSIGGSYPAYGYFFKDLVFSDVSNSKTTHGLYLNIGSNVYFENVTFNGMGIGLCLNGTIECNFVSCNFTYCYVGVFDTTSTGSNTTITNVNGQTVTITNAFQTIQPGLQSFLNCNWYICNIAYYFEQPNNPYNTDAGLQFRGGSIEGCGSGVYLQPYSFHPCIFDGIWIENTSLSSNSLRSITIPGQNINTQGGNVNIRNTVISSITSANGAIITVEDCDVIATPDFNASGTSAILCKNLLVDNLFIATYCDGGRNSRANRSFGFYTTPKNYLSAQYNDFVVYSNPCTAAFPLLTGYGSPTITAVTSDSVFYPIQSNQAVIAAGDGLRSGTFTINNNYVYVQTFTAKSLGTAGSYFFTSNTINGAIVIGNIFRTFAQIITTTNSGSDSVIFLNQTGSTSTLLISGWQILAFPDYELANEFLKSNSFNV